MKLTERVALVTGGSSGIGRGVAKLLAAEGAKVGLIDWDEGGLLDAVAEIERDGGEALSLHADVSDPAQMKEAVATLIATWNRLDILVANAAINGIYAPIDEIEPEEWDRTLDINLKGTFLAFHYAVPHLKVRGGSAMVVSSLHGTRTFTIAGSTAYACSKGGQVILAKKMALELARHRIRVNAICPGSTTTRINDSKVLRNIESIDLGIQFPQGKQPLTGRAATPEEVARVALFLASDDSSIVTGAEIHVDAGMSLVMG